MRPHAYTVWLALNTASSFMSMLLWTVVAVYFVTVVGMNPFELVLVGTVSEIAIFLFEVPTGVLADTYSRRLSVILGYALQGAAFGVIAAFADVGVILAAAALYGLARTFESGALEAWIADEVGGRDLERVFLRASQLQYVGSLLGIGASVGLALVDLRLPLVAASIAGVAIAVALAVFMPERGFRRSRAHGQSWRRLGPGALAGARAVRASAALVVIVAIAVFFGASSEALDRLWEAHFLTSFRFPRVGDLEPIVWFGIVNAARLALAFVVTGIVLRRLRPTRPLHTVEALLVIDLVLVVALAGFAIAETFYVAVAAFLVARVARSLHAPLFSAWLNQNTESSVRATVNSLVSQSGAIGEVGGGPALGALGALASIRAALAASAVLLVPAAALYVHALRRGGREPELREVPAS